MKKDSQVATSLILVVLIFLNIFRVYLGMSFFYIFNLNPLRYKTRSFYLYYFIYFLFLFL